MVMKQHNGEQKGGGRGEGRRAHENVRAERWREEGGKEST